MRSKALLRFSASVTVALLGFASVAYAQNQPPPPYNPPPGYQQQPPPIYQQQPPPPAYQQPPAYYPPPPPPPRGMYRDGLLVGFAVGFGAISAADCSDYCGGAFGAEFHIGGMLNPRLALMYDGWINIRPVPNSDATTSNTINAFALQYWLTDILWIKGGLGLGTTSVTVSSTNQSDDRTGMGILGAAGIELFQGNGFAFDLQARIGTAFHSSSATDVGNVSNFGFLAGFNWY